MNKLIKYTNVNGNKYMNINLFFEGKRVKTLSPPLQKPHTCTPLLPHSTLLKIPIQSMFASVTNSSTNILRHCALLRPRVTPIFLSLLHRLGASAPMDNNARSNPFSSYAHASPRFSSLFFLGIHEFPFSFCYQTRCFLFSVLN